MLTPISVIILIFATFALSRVILRSKDKTISFLESIFWVIIWLIIIFFTIFPQITDKISKIIGVGRGIDAAFFLAIILLFYIVFRLYVKLDSLDRQLTDLNRELTKQFGYRRKPSPKKNSSSSQKNLSRD